MLPLYLQMDYSLLPLFGQAGWQTQLFSSKKFIAIADDASLKSRFIAYVGLCFLFNFFPPSGAHC